MYNLNRSKFGIGNCMVFRMWVREIPFNYLNLNDAFLCK
ncbi:hypothetical protein K1T44_2173 [Listeria innocua]|nr:hypothetical protein K1T44_2173 [Listeria innocua]